MQLVAPAGTAQPLAAVSSGRAVLGLADLIDVTLANRQGAGLRVVAAVVQRPLVSLMARADGPVRRPRDLVGRTVGLTGVPSDRAVARTIIKGDGGDPDRVHYVVIGFSAVPSLVGRKVDAAIGFWPADGVELERRTPARIFRLERFGGPAFPELVIFARASTLRRSPGLVRSFLSATSEGYALARSDPAKALSDLEHGAHGIDPAVAKASLKAYRPILADAHGEVRHRRSHGREGLPALRAPRRDHSRRDALVDPRLVRSGCPYFVISMNRSTVTVSPSVVP